MIKKIKAFTVAEIMICLVIIGVIITFISSGVKMNDKKYAPVISNIYSNLDRAVYDLKLNDNSNTLFNNTNFCEELGKYLNATNTNCNNTFNVDPNFSGSPNITLGNGIDLYITPVFNDAKPFFVLIYTDVNGAKRPNSLDYGTRGRKPDIVTFAALESGRVIPMGALEYDKNLLSASVIHASRGSWKNADLHLSNKKLSYMEAKNEAWGYNPIYPPTNFRPDIPFLANDIIRNRAKSSYPDINKNIISHERLPINETLGCSDEELMNCGVVIDKYAY